MSTRSSHVRKDPVRPVTLTVIAVGAVAFALACADASRSTSPAAVESVSPRPAPGALAHESSDGVVPGVVTLCKVGADGRFLVQVGTGTAPTTHSMGHNSCKTIASVPPAQRDDVIVTITEEKGTTYALEHIVLRHGTNAARTIKNERSVSFEAAHGAIVTYHNAAVVTVCKRGTAATMQYQFGLGQPTLPLSLADGECKPIGTIPAAQPDDVIVTVRENPSASYALDHMMMIKGLGAAEKISGPSHVSFEGVHGAVLTFHNKPVGTSGHGGTVGTGDKGAKGGTEQPQKKECVADKSQKDAKVHNTNHDCRSPQGAEKDPKSSGDGNGKHGTTGKSGKNG